VSSTSDYSPTTWKRSLMQNSVLPNAIDADLHSLTVSGGVTLRYYADTHFDADKQGATARPLVLLHSVNAAPSAMEVSPLFTAYRGKRPVYAVDLPGFGQSQRGPLAYSPSFFAQCLHDFLVALEGEPADIVALSLTTEFAARALGELNAPANSLVGISPTGFSRRQPPGESVSRKVDKVVGTPLLGRGLFRLLTSGPSIRFFLSKAFVGPIPKPLLDYAQTTARVADAHYGPFAFLSMRLFTPSAPSTLYSKVSQPFLVLHDRDPNVDFTQLPAFAGKHSNVQVGHVAPSLGLPHWELLPETVAALDAFWQRTLSSQQ